MMQHLEEAKKLDKPSSKSNRTRWTGLQRKVRKHSNVAILSKNYSNRLEELVKRDAITHRSGSRLASAAAAFDAHSQLPIYYRTGDTVTHAGIITNLILDPDSESREAEKFRAHISEDDDYGDHNEELDTTTYIVEHGRELEEPFEMTQLQKVSDNEPIDEDFWRSPAYVFYREGDFPFLNK
ncbi:hypothetical protein AUR66_18170 [Haloferax profundi]|uniref:Uncharacterized protein n=2 Tax=Haloferax profundi TaxID=1544718 RepID=A0A0W1RYJ3_9EURY|nr:hypothetical protein AUR66_18170 [Haloferax profundi]